VDVFADRIAAFLIDIERRECRRFPATDARKILDDYEPKFWPNGAVFTAPWRWPLQNLYSLMM
jgi:hypothetical protein